jgi:hypothetical protein
MRKERVEMLTVRQLEDGTKCLKIGCTECACQTICLKDGGINFDISITAEASQTALAYRAMLKKLLQVMEGFDYRANVKYTISDCISAEIDAKALLKSGEVEG